MTGIVTHWNSRRGFGFIRPLVGLGPDTPTVFFHITAVAGARPVTVAKGMEVSFRLVRGDKGPQALDVEARELSGSVLGRKPDTQAKCPARGISLALR